MRSRKLPPTPLQVEAMQLLMVERSLHRAARARGVSYSVMQRAVAGCVKRAANIPDVVEVWER